MNNEFFDGILYQVEYHPELSNNDYTQHKVYYIKTDDDNWGHAKKKLLFPSWKTFKIMSKVIFRAFLIKRKN